MHERWIGVEVVRFSRKVLLMLAVPLVFVIGLAAWAGRNSVEQARGAEQLQRLVVASEAAGELAYRLQLERAAAVASLTGSLAEPATFSEQVRVTDAAAGGLDRAQAALSPRPPGLAGLLDRIGGQLARLQGVREGVASGEGRASVVAFAYRILIADLISLREQVGQAGGAPPEVADRLRAAASLSTATETLGLLQVAVLRSEAYGPLSLAGLQEITAARTANVDALLSFDQFATAPWRAALERSAVGPQVLAGIELEDAVARTPVGQRLAVDSVEWAAAINERMTRQRQVEAGVDRDIFDQVSVLRDEQWRLTAVQVAGAVLAVVAAALVAAWLSRPMIRNLHALRDAAHAVAYQRLPETVARLEQLREVGDQTPRQLAASEPAAVVVKGRDELAEVGRAFNELHRAAIRVAAEQATTRLRVRQMFMNLARRSQTLSGQAAQAMDELERHEEDPKRLALMYKVDLPVTLLERTADALLVLGGGASGRVPEGDQPLTDVLKAAGSRVRDYERVVVGWVDDGLSVRADAVDDVVLLLAELIDNALRWSDSNVQINARWLHDRVIVQIIDEGIGIHPSQREALNRRLASLPPLDVEATRSMGTTVVATLAHQHGIRVELRAGERHHDAQDTVGTIAEVTLPRETITVAPGAQPAMPARRQLPAASIDTRQVAAASAALPGWSGVPHQRGLPTGPVAGPWAGGGGWAQAPTRELVPAVAVAPVGDPPLYREVRKSMWFDPPVRTASPQGLGGGQQDAAGWSAAADAGWQAAARAERPTADGLTRGGLPRRQPQAHLVPGGVETPASASPAVVRWRDSNRAGLVAAAYQRGIVNGRRQSVVAAAGGGSTGTDREPRR